MFYLCQLEKKYDGFTASASLLIVLLDGPEVWQRWQSKPSFLLKPGILYLIATGTVMGLSVSAEENV